MVRSGVWECRTRAGLTGAMVITSRRKLLRCQETPELFPGKSRLACFSFDSRGEGARPGACDLWGEKGRRCVAAVAPLVALAREARAPQARSILSRGMLN